ncbi:hypothetical protein YC2023_092351 [Brassica napus]
MSFSFSFENHHFFEKARFRSAATFSGVNQVPAQANKVAPLTVLKSSTVFSVTRNSNSDITSLASNR